MARCISGNPAPRKRVFILALTTALVFLSACYSQPASGPLKAVLPDSPAAAGPTLAAGLPPLPIEKTAAEQTDTVIPGVDTYMSENTGIVLGKLQLQSTTGTTAWGIWELPTGGNELLNVKLLVSVPLGQKYWVALSNYATGGWQFHGPYASDSQLNLSNASNVSAGGSCYVAAVAYDGDTPIVDKLIVSIDRHGWQIVTVDAAGDAGAYSSLAVINGNPAISYQAHDGSDTISQRYVRSTSVTGAAASDWNEPVIVDTSSSVHHTFSDTSLAEINGNPAIVYSLYTHSTGITERKYVRSTTATGDAPGDWQGYVVLESDTTRDIYNALAEIAGNPAVCYFHVEEDGADYHHNIIYLRSTSSTGDAPGDWTQLVTLESETKTGSYFDIGWQVSLVDIGGNPAVSYTQGFLHGAVKYARATTATGEIPLDWPAPLAVDSGNTLFDASLAEVDGNPALSYFDNTDGELKYARSTTASGADAGDWTQLVTIISDGNPGMYSSLAVIAGNPAISYLANPGLGYVRSTDASGGNAASWLAAPDMVDDTAGTGWYTSLAEVDGKPAISYYDGSDEDLKYAILFE